MKLSILGAGAWGTALASHAAQRQDVLLWARDATQLQQMRRRGENLRYLPGIGLAERLGFECELGVALDHAGVEGLLVFATPVAGLRELAQAVRAHGAPLAPVMVLAKGFERDTGLLPHQVLEQVFDGWELRPSVGVVSGPSFAQEVARGLPVALTAASSDAASSARAVLALHGGTMRVYASADPLGVAVGGAVKNVLAIACGVSDGLEQGHNARAALITRGLAEMARLGLALGASMETFMGLSGLGDLVLTCTGELSRNRRVGLQLAAGKGLADIVRELGHVAEGVQTAQTVLAQARRLGVEMPITAAVCAVLDGSRSAAQALQGLLAREPRAEHPDRVVIRLIVGLGNPGPEHAQQRHNAGFWWVNQIVQRERLELRVERGFFGEVARWRTPAGDVWLLEPNTYMNRSGQAVAALARFYKIEPEQILVAHDELDLLPGQVKLKLGGGHAGHNGLRDIASQLGSAQFWRLRLGIGHPGDRAAVVGFVLGRPQRAELELIEKGLQRGLEVLPQLLRGELALATQQLHRENLPPRPKPDPRPDAAV